LYTGNATIKEISSSVNSTSFTFLFDCIGCYFWDQGGVTGNADTTIGTILQSWSQAWSSTSALVDPSNPNTSEGQHDTQGNLGIPVSAAVNSQYSAWFTKTKTASTTATSTSASATATTYKSIPIPSGANFNYVVVGGGAGGVPIADKVSETGKSTLLSKEVLHPPEDGAGVSMLFQYQNNFC
jgi:cellobiose dehydrogenase (acceptor)